MTKSIGIIAAYSKPEAADLAVRIKDQLQSMGCDVVAERELAQATPQTLRAIIVLGGDGLMMRAASMYPDIPLFGINFGKVGFLAMVEQRDWLIAVNALVSGLYSVQDAATLAATVHRGSDPLVVAIPAPAIAEDDHGREDAPCGAISGVELADVVQERGRPLVPWGLRVGGHQPFEHRQGVALIGGRARPPQGQLGGRQLGDRRIRLRTPGGQRTEEPSGEVPRTGHRRSLIGASLAGGRCGTRRTTGSGTPAYTAGWC